MTIKAFELKPGERIIDTWPLMYSPPEGSVLDGRCTITNLRILYSSRVDTGERKQKDREYLVIHKTEIREIETKKSYREKRIILTLDNGDRHEFSYGALNIDRLVDAMSRLS